jgi:thiol:disulfide interchange protein DsbD
MRSLLLILAFLSPFSAAWGAAVRTEHVTAELVTENTTLRAGAANQVGVRLEMVPHWHTYWRFPGDSGLPTEIVWHLPAGWSAGPLEWRKPERLFVPPLVNYGYEGETLIGAPLTVPPGAAGVFELGASVSWLVCKEECVPEKAELALKVRVAPGRPKAGPLAYVFRRLAAEQPRKLASPVATEEKGASIGIVVPGEVAGSLAAADFLPLAPMLVKGDAPPKVEKKGGSTVLWLAKSDPFDAKAETLPGMLITAGGTYEVSATLTPHAAAAPAVTVAPGDGTSAWLLVAFGLLGGVVLNLMPCVFPVLGIKVMSLVRQGGENKAHARLHGHAYAAGVVASFWVLAGALVALRSAGQAVGWGFQLQQPMFVTALVLLFTFVAADLAGFIHWSGRWMGAGSGLAEREGLGGSFFTGVLAVVVATPCTAPFMGTAVGAAIGEPAWVVMLVFTALGVGLALPFVLLCYQPAYLRALPKPGAWMERLKELLAFPVAATVVWLLWVLAQQIGADGAFKVEGGLLVLIFSVWVRRRFASGGARAFSHALLFLGVLLCALGARSVPAGAPEAQGPWKPYSEAALNGALDAGKPVFVDFTAAWCLTCQVNRKLVLERAGTLGYFREKGVVLLLADWTNRDPEITRALEREGRLGVPLYLAYRAGSRQAEVLPQILTEGRIRSTFP